MLLVNVSRSMVRSSALRSASRYMSSLGDTLEKKGKVEEDRFIRAQDAAKLAKLHGELLQQAQEAASAKDVEQFDEVIAPLIAEIKGMLASGESLSPETLKAIAKWKLSLH